jgi:UDP-3-O-[3-hydroxymyristoyl] N-acetylglucosamine deacetylase
VPYNDTDALPSMARRLQAQTVSNEFPFKTLPVWQHTLRTPVRAKGVGLHTGQPVQLEIKPAAANSGLVFSRLDMRDPPADIVLHPEAVCETRRGTRIQNADGVSVATTEHLLAALLTCGIDNAVIGLDVPEVPAMDGSARPFCDAIRKAGLLQQDQPRRYLEVTAQKHCGDDLRYVSIRPGKSMHIEASIDYPDTLIGQQSCAFDVTPDRFIHDIAPARTFVIADEIEVLKAAKLARGGSLDNCIVVEGMHMQNLQPLRFKDEFVRHKILDSLGDLALAGAPVLGYFTSYRAGHALNNTLLRALMADASAWRWTTLL